MIKRLALFALALFAIPALAADTPATDLGNGNFSCPVTNDLATGDQTQAVSVALVRASDSTQVACSDLVAGASAAVNFVQAVGSDELYNARGHDGAACSGNSGALSVDTCSANTIEVSVPTIP